MRTRSTRQRLKLYQKTSFRKFFGLGVMLTSIGIVLTLVFNTFFSVETKALQTPLSLSLQSPSLVSGIAGKLGAVYNFVNVFTGIDVELTISDISNGATISNIDLPSSTTGYSPAFQPTVTFASGTNSNPVTSYMEFTLRFKKGGSNTDTIVSSISATAIDIDGNNKIQESVEAFTPNSYSTNSDCRLSITQFSNSVRADAYGVDFGGIDSTNKEVMFQMNFENVSEIRYRVRGTNKGGAVVRQSSIYFKGFFDNSTPLPVKLSSFTGEVLSKSKVRLKWITETEVNNDFFTVERSKDGSEFEKIGTVTGSGTSSMSNEYSLTDFEPFSGLMYYRLRQTDYDGKDETFPIIRISNTGQEEDFQITDVFPNPFKDQMSVQVNSFTKEPVRLLLVNSSGVVVKEISIPGGETGRVFQLSELGTLPDGVYFLSALKGWKSSNTVTVLKRS